MNFPGLILGLAMTGAGTVGLVVTIRGEGDAGPIGDWLRARFGPRMGLSPEQALAGSGLDSSAAVTQGAVLDDATFSFKGKIYTGATVRSRLVALFWLVLVIGVVALVIAATLFAAGTLINSVVRSFVSG